MASGVVIEKIKTVKTHQNKCESDKRDEADNELSPVAGPEFVLQQVLTLRFLRHSKISHGARLLHPKWFIPEAAQT